MRVTVELNPELGARLSARAESVGVEPAEILKRLLSMYLLDPPEDGERARREEVMRGIIEESERLGLYR